MKEVKEAILKQVELHEEATVDNLLEVAASLVARGLIKSVDVELFSMSISGPHIRGIDEDFFFSVFGPRWRADVAERLQKTDSVPEDSAVELRMLRQAVQQTQQREPGTFVGGFRREEPTAT